MSVVLVLTRDVNDAESPHVGRVAPLAEVRHEEMDLDEVAHVVDLRLVDSHPREDRPGELGAFFRVPAALDLPDVVEESGEIERLSVGDLRVDPCEGVRPLELRLAELLETPDDLEAVLVDGIVMIEIVPLQAREKIVLGDHGAQETGVVHRAENERDVVGIGEKADERFSHACPLRLARELGIEHIGEPPPERPVELETRLLLPREYIQGIPSESSRVELEREPSLELRRLAASQQETDVVAVAELLDDVPRDPIDRPRVLVVVPHEELRRRGDRPSRGTRGGR